MPHKTIPELPNTQAYYDSSTNNEVRLKFCDCKQHHLRRFLICSNREEISFDNGRN